MDPIISWGKNDETNPTTISMGLGGLASNSEDLLITYIPTRFKLPIDTISDSGTIDTSASLYDYVVDYHAPDANGWEWRIWASGKTEIWLYKELTSISETQTISGSDTTNNARVYRREFELGDFPVDIQSMEFDPKPYTFSLGYSGTTAPSHYPLSIVGTTKTYAGKAYVGAPNSSSATFTFGIYWIAERDMDSGD